MHRYLLRVSLFVENCDLLFPASKIYSLILQNVVNPEYPNIVDEHYLCVVTNLFLRSFLSSFSFFSSSISFSILSSMPLIFRLLSDLDLYLYKIGITCSFSFSIHVFFPIVPVVFHPQISLSTIFKKSSQSPFLL